MGGIVVGNWLGIDIHQHAHSHSFLYYIDHTVLQGRYYELVYEDESGVAMNITAYGIYWFGGSDYIIVGGVNRSGFIVDWNSDSEEASNWRLFKYPGSNLTHFQGVHCDSELYGINCSFAADYQKDFSTNPCFAYMYNLSAVNGSEDILWVDYEIPVDGVVFQSSNSVFMNNTIGSYGEPKRKSKNHYEYKQTYSAYFTFIPQPATLSSDNSSTLGAWELLGIVLGGLVTAYVIYLTFFYPNEINDLSGNASTNPLTKNLLENNATV